MFHGNPLVVSCFSADARIPEFCLLVVLPESGAEGSGATLTQIEGQTMRAMSA